MENQYVVQRLAGIQQALVGIHRAGTLLSSATKGAEREHFINTFLGEVFPSSFRFGTGDITDSMGKKTGQIDVVVEFPFLPSLPTAKDSPRLYLAEGVAAALEVKSDVSAQWTEVERTSAQVRPLVRKFGSTLSVGDPPAPQIPLFAVGYTGWTTLETVQSHASSGIVDGILVIDSMLFADRNGGHGTGPWALWGLICRLHEAISTLKSTSMHPGVYSQK